MLTLRANTFCCVAAAMTASTSAVGPATTVCRGEENTVTATPGWPAINASVADASSSSSATAPLSVSADISRDRAAITFRPSAGVSAPATTAADTSPMECPIKASGSMP